MTLFFRQWQGELLKLFARRRTFIGFGVFLALEAFILFRLRTGGLKNMINGALTRQGASLEYYDSALTMALQVLGISCFLLGGIYITLIAGDIVAKENEDGHFRLLLVRPISRLRLLAVKFLTCCCYTLVLVQFMAWSSFLLGLAIKGWGGGFFALLLVDNVSELHDWNDGLYHYATASLFLAFAMTVISSIAFFLSCFSIKPAAATIGALSYALSDLILKQTPYMQDYEHLLLTKHIAAWGQLLLASPDWAVVTRSFTVLVAVNASLFIAGAAVFESRDLKS
ncbi:MAG: ABC transporter permease [Verrucomicrobiota bacterium]